MPIVTLSNNKTFNADRGGTVLDNALASGIVLEYSCRTGRCGICKAKVLSGETTIKLHEQALTHEDLLQNYILTCCRAASSDVELNVEDLGLLANIQAKTLPCRIDSIERLANDVVKVLLRLPPNSAFNYLPGQHISIIGQGGVRRSYSIANAASHNGKLELHIRWVDGGVMSRYWFEEAHLNDLLRFEGPLGTFSLRETTFQNLIFLSTGTGIAPVKAMLESLAMDSNARERRSIYVYWGGRTTSDLYLKFCGLGTLDMVFTPVLSQPESGWVGRTGYVQHALLRDGLDLTSAVVYACGSREMINSARTQLVAAGLDKSKYYADAFVGSN